MGFGRVARTGRRHPYITAFMLLAVLGFGAVGVAGAAPLTVPYLVIVITGALAIGFLDDRVTFSTPVLVALALWAAGHLAGGLVELGGGRILYNAVFFERLHFDNVVHFVGFGASGVACWEGLRDHLVTAVAPRVIWLVAFIAAMGVGAANEVVEFAATHLLDATQVGGYQNTGRDLVANMLGGAVGGAWAAARGVMGSVRR